jgi:hypothetical protein
MATAPFQLWVDLAQIASAVRTSSTVTVTTASPHGISTGAYVQMANATGTAGTSMNGVYEITATSGSTFTYTSAGTAGTGVTGSAVISADFLNPLNNYSGTAKEQAVYVPTESLAFSISGDGSGASSSFTVLQDDTPADGPWFSLIPDQTRVRLVKASTGGTPAADGSDVFFTAAVANVSAGLVPSGQGTRSDLALQDMTSLLEKVVVYSYGNYPRLVAQDGLVRSGGTVYVTTNVSHGLSDGGTVAISGANGGGTSTVGDAPFNGAAFAISNVTPNTFTYFQGATNQDSTGNIEVTPTAGTVYSGTAGQFKLTFATGTNMLDSSSIVVVSGITSNYASAQDRVNNVFTGFSSAGANEMVLTVAGTLANDTTFNVSNAKVRKQAVVTPAGTLGGLELPVVTNTTETAAVNQVLTAVNNFKSYNPAFQRLFNTAGTAKIVGASDLTVKEDFDIPAGSMRSVLDALVETFQGLDGKPRRYFVDVNGNLNYKVVSDSDKPTYATAPYKLITSGTQNPDTTTGAATLIPYDLQIGYDLQTIKGGMTTTNAGTAFKPFVTTYLDYGYAERKNSPLFDAFFDSVEVTETAKRKNEYEYGRSFFLQAHPPLLSGQVTLRGAGTAAHNQYGFNAGYAQTGASTFALVNRWEPGQWVDITCAELGLSGLFRIEQVDWTLERGSFTQIITLIFSYKPQFALTNQLAQVR